MIVPGAPRYRALVRPALLTAAASLLAFGVAHAAFITWVVDRSEDPSLLLRLGVMLGAPMMIGALPAALSAALGALVWQRAWSTPLASWRWGLVFASALAPAVALNLALGPAGDAPRAWAMPFLVAAIVVVPGALGAWVARSPWGLAAGIVALPAAATVSMFLQAQPLSGWVTPFVLSMVLIFGASGWIMARLVRPREPFSPGVGSTAA